MGFISRTWKDRKTEYPNRRLLTKENGGTELVTVSREEGIISEEGSAFSAENMNDLEKRIQTAIGAGDIPQELGTDITGALDVLGKTMKSLTRLEMFTFRPVVVSAGSYATLSRDDITLDGYTPVGLAGFGSSHVRIGFASVFISGNSLGLTITNSGTSNITAADNVQVQARVLYIKDM